eukprot:TRINITY_DN1271_c0_g2_i1.p1 TRINITY_DN1271_c0_g2~~TRINITY_DN1271_c0_g2_i1.p1  ORF type:complete len:706 (+),score=187.05 TRINITY_DN1271_c0_g2_i1:94-2118(+)
MGNVGSLYIMPGHYELEVHEAAGGDASPAHPVALVQGQPVGQPLAIAPPAPVLPVMVLSVSPEQRELEGKLVGAVNRVNEKCKLAKRSNRKMIDTPLNVSPTGKTVIVCCGPINSGKSGFINSMVTGNASSDMCRTDIKTETCDATRIRFGSGYSVNYHGSGEDYYNDHSAFRKALSDAQQRTRKSGSARPGIIDAQVVSEGLKFNGGEAAVLLDTPGYDEEPKDKGDSMQVFVQELIRQHGTNLVLLYFLRMDSGISTSYGECLKAQQKEFLKATGVAGSRLIVVCSMYDLFVHGQTVEVESHSCWGSARARAPPEEARQMAKMSFDHFKQAAAQELATHGMSGAAFLPYAYLEPEIGISALSLEDRCGQMQSIHQEVAKRVKRAQWDTVVAGWAVLRNELNARLTSAAGTGLGPAFVSNCIEAARAELDRMPDGVDGIVKEKSAELQDGLFHWVHQDNYMNALLEKTCDPVQEFVNKLRQEAQQKAGTYFKMHVAEEVGHVETAQSVIEFSKLDDNFALFRGFGMNMLYTGCGAVAGVVGGAAGAVVAEVVVAEAALYAAVAVGSCAAVVVVVPFVAAVTAIKCLSDATDWEYDDADKRVVGLWTERVRSQRQVFVDNLRRALEAEAQAVTARMAAGRMQAEDMLKPLHKEVNDMYDSLVRVPGAAPAPIAP